MMLAAAGPDDTGPIVINGAPMSYWGGAWSEGEGDNPMRYAGGMLGGAWLSSFAADLGNDNIRVNAISAGPMRTLAGSAVGDARMVFKWNKAHSPLKRSVDWRMPCITCTRVAAPLANCPDQNCNPS